MSQQQQQQGGQGGPNQGGMDPQTISDLIQSSLRQAYQNFSNEFQNIRNEIKGLQTNMKANTESIQATMNAGPNANRQQIINDTVLRNRSELRVSLAANFASQNVEVSAAKLDQLVAGQLGQGKDIQKMRVEDLPKFDGTDVYSYLISVDTAVVQFQQAAVANMIPRTFEGKAKRWWNIVSDEEKVKLLNNVYRFRQALEDEFQDAVGFAKDRARNRSWKIGHEDITTYYYEKLDLLISAHHRNLTDADICYEIREGLPLELRPYIRTLLERSPSSQRLRKELQTLENDFVKIWKQSSTRGRSTSEFPLTPPMSTTSSSRSVSPVYRRSNDAPLKESYDPDKVGQQRGPDGKMIRTYTLPSGTVLLLKRTCRVGDCRGNHFDFEHDHVNKKRAHSLVMFEGFPIADYLEDTSHDEHEDMIVEEDEDVFGDSGSHVQMVQLNSPTEIDTSGGTTGRFARRRGTKN